jgi:hypothetical protein
MVTNDTPGDRRLANIAGGAIAVIGQAIKDGLGGTLKRIGSILRAAASQPFLEAIADEMKAMADDGRIKPGREAAPETMTALAEVVDDLDTSIPDARRLDMLR